MMGIYERRLKWHAHDMRRDGECVGKRVTRIDVEGRRRKGRPKRRWMDSVNVVMREKGCRGKRCNTGLCGGNLSDSSTHMEVGKEAMEEECLYYW